MNRPLRILLAEDNSGDVYLVQQSLALHKIQHILTVVSDGDQAFRYLQNLANSQDDPCPDLILLDLNLPKKDGHEILTAIRADGRCRAIPVIIITSSDSPRDRKRSADLGANRYFKKPFDFEEFLGLGVVIKDVLGTTGATAAS